jgi:hypothetical protein
MSAHVQPPEAGVLTTRQAHEYCAQRTLFEHLLAKCGLQPIWMGQSHKSVLYRRSEIDQALDVLRLNGGWDADKDSPIKDS